ncbi:phosphatidylglycerophosphatase A [Candidatus Uabimicrobium sp. HlEnr_7]|uniref:phosphatidylglycerophosphatase A family protein n=1 Tax=Candidatus Uabimicrobium helgolandensis TaxID=3095367 RepID=UPI003557C3FC
MDFLCKIIATFFFLGNSPKMPGTAGTVGAMVLYFILLFTNVINFYVLLACMLGASILNILIGKWAENYYKTKDPQKVVIDEVAGYFLTVMWFQPSVIVAIVGFIAFRIFDGGKPYPIRKVEVFPHGFGVLADDLLAGVYSALTLIALSYLLPLINASWTITLFQFV